MKFKHLSLCMVLAFAMSSTTFADVIVFSQGDARIFTSNMNANGGVTNSGALIGLNTAGVDNILLHNFDNLSAVAGTTVTGATITANVATGFTNPNHGTADDTIVLSEIYVGNSGWDQGNTAITTGSATDGSVSYAFQSTTGNAATEVQWMDANGSVSDIRGALTTVATSPGYPQGGGTPTVTFNVSAAIAQNWVDNGLGGLALSVIDSGDSQSRFNFQFHNEANPNFSIDFDVVPEPSSALVLAVAGFGMIARRRR